MWMQEEWNPKRIKWIVRMVEKKCQGNHSNFSIWSPRSSNICHFLVAPFVVPVFWITTGFMEKKSQECSTFHRNTQKARQEFTKMHVNQPQSFWENILLNWWYKTEPFWPATTVVPFYVWKGTNKFILVCNCFQTQETLYSSSTTILYMAFADHRKHIQIWLELSFVLFIASPSRSKEVVHSRNLVLCLHETIWTACLKKKPATLSYNELNPIFGPLYSR